MEQQMQGSVTSWREYAGLLLRGGVAAAALIAQVACVTIEHRPSVYVGDQPPIVVPPAVIIEEHRHPTTYVPVPVPVYPYGAPPPRHHHRYHPPRPR